MYLYQEMLDPDLYDNSFVAEFIDTLKEPEVDIASSDQLSRLKKEMMAMDDIDDLAESIRDEAQEKITTTGTLAPQFIAFPDHDYKVRFEVEKNIPTKPENIQRFLAAGKALAMIRAAQCIFFSTMQPLKNDAPAIGKDVIETNPWGIIIVGSSLRGNCFVQLQQITRNSEEICFNTIHQKILREGNYAYPFSQFFHIHNHDEMNNIIMQIPKLIARTNTSEKECIINFATTLKSLKHFGY